MEQCSKCGKNRPIANKKYWLCSDCNFERLHKGVSRAVIYQQRVAERVEVKMPRAIRAKYTPIRKQTERESVVKQKLSILKRIIEEDAVQDGQYYCWGCGKSSGALDKSHILSVEKRKDLELDRANINLFCRECHMNWESGDITKMIMLRTFEKDLEYIKEKDPRRYNQLVIMIEDAGMDMFNKFVDGEEVNEDVRNKLRLFGQKYEVVEIEKAIK